MTISETCCHSYYKLFLYCLSLFLSVYLSVVLSVCIAFLSIYIYLSFRLSPPRLFQISVILAAVLSTSHTCSTKIYTCYTFYHMFDRRAPVGYASTLLEPTDADVVFIALASCAWLFIAGVAQCPLTFIFIAQYSNNS